MNQNKTNPHIQPHQESNLETKIIHNFQKSYTIDWETSKPQEKGRNIPTSKRKLTHISNHIKEQNPESKKFQNIIFRHYQYYNQKEKPHPRNDRSGDLVDTLIEIWIEWRKPRKRFLNIRNNQRKSTIKEKEFQSNNNRPLKVKIKPESKLPCGKLRLDFDLDRLISQSTLVSGINVKCDNCRIFLQLS